MAEDFADLAERRGAAQCFPHGVEEVLRSACGGGEIREGGVDGWLVSVRPDLLGALDLAALGLRVDREDVWWLDGVIDVLVDADDDLVLSIDREREVVRRSRDLVLHEATLDCRDRASH